jgi:anti-sigma factor RsiW
MKEGGEISLDAILVAYLDGELEPEAHEKLERLLKSDPSVRERLAMLSRGTRPFKRTFDKDPSRQTCSREVPSRGVLLLGLAIQRCRDATPRAK